MASIKDRLLALEAMRPHDSTAMDSYRLHAVYFAHVMLGFVDDRADPVGGMIRQGIPEDEARRFGEMGFHMVQRTLRAKLSELESVLH